MRLFAALDPPEEIREALACWAAGQLADPALRPTRASALHITLCFMGECSDGQAERAGRLIGTLPGEAATVCLSGPVAKPRHRPAIYALEARSEGAVALQARLAERLADAGLYERERRAFWPHLTIARVRSERGRRRPQNVAAPPGELPAELREPWDAVRVSLYRSKLRPDGAQYVPLAKRDLKPR